MSNRFFILKDLSCRLASNFEYKHELGYNIIRDTQTPSIGFRFY